MNNENTSQPKTIAKSPSGGYRPKLMFFHASPKGNGSAIQFELHPAHDDVDGSLFATLANQMSIGNARGPNPTFPRFDWSNAITIKLDFSDISQMLQVFRGECESINDDKGLFHESLKSRTSIRFKHLLEPSSGYLFEVYRTSKSGGEDTNVRFFFKTAEAMGLSTAIENAMSYIAFGIPKVIPRENFESRNMQVKAGDVSAA